MKMKIELPFFPGFYETWAYSSDNDYFTVKELVDDYACNYGVELDPDNDFELDFEGYKHAICEAFIDAWKEYLPVYISVSKEDFSLVSPKYYNYSTDRVFVDIELADNWLDEMLGFIYKNKDWFSERIHEDWTSRSGFMSFMENNIDGWVEKLKTGDSQYVETTLGYIAFFNNKNIKENLMYDTLENVYLSEYYRLTQTGKAKMGEI